MNLGLLPRQLTFHRDKDNHFHSERIDTYDFLSKYVDLKLDDYVSIINAPTADKPYGRSYTVEMLKCRWQQ